jgi:hypothetical protein
MTGDQADIVARIKAVLPTGWFAEDSPVLTALLDGLSYGWSWVYDWIHYTRRQTRISTATGIFLDLIALDYFGAMLRRRSGETDHQFRHRIKINLLRDRATRAAVISVLTDLTGRAPTVFEPAYSNDTGGYGSLTQRQTGLAYNTAGGWGSLSLPFQFFVTARRPLTTGITMVSGWGCPAGGYGVGAIEYADLSSKGDIVTDSEIYAAVAATRPVGTTAWMNITN